jgi:predicted ribosomally synthesized peptide with nif11-like leader
MASKDVDAFIRAAELDPPLADALLNASGLDELVEMGSERGYDFTRDEITTYLGSGSDELGDGQLDGVAGGADQPVCYLKYKLDRCFVKSWSTSGDVE